MQLVPGNGSATGAAESVLPRTLKTTAIPPPGRRDPAIAIARKKQRDIELKRRGRRASILTSRRGVTQSANVSRPAARKTKLLGQVGE